MGMCIHMFPHLLDERDPACVCPFANDPAHASHLCSACIGACGTMLSTRACVRAHAHAPLTYWPLSWACSSTGTRAQRRTGAQTQQARIQARARTHMRTQAHRHMQAHARACMHTHAQARTCGRMQAHAGTRRHVQAHASACTRRHARTHRRTHSHARTCRHMPDMQAHA